MSHVVPTAADQTFDGHMANAEQALVDIEEGLARLSLQRTALTSSGWACVGDAASIADELTHIADRLLKRGEHAETA